MEVDLSVSLPLAAITSLGMRHRNMDAVDQIARITSLVGIIQLATSG
jgi:hypothetical protein